MVFVLKVPETLYQPFAKRCSHITPYQVLIFSFCPHHLLLVIWELIVGYVTPLD
jgi:GTP cyclohydrolase I